MSRTCAVVINSRAGSPADGTDPWGDLEEKLRQRGVTATVHPCTDPMEIARQVEAALEDGVSVVVAGGGDGTVSSVAALLAGTDATLGVLPIGTLNNFARDLGIPLDIDAALDVIAAGNVARVDAGRVNEHVFVNNSSIGIYPTLVRLREARQMRGERKWTAALRAMITALRLYPLMNVRLTIDGMEIVRRTPLLFVGNNEYQLEGMEMARRLRLDAGRLGIAVTRDVGRLGLFALLFRAIVRHAHQAETLDLFTANELIVESRHANMRVSADGEIHMEPTPLRYRSLPGALRVLVPEQEGKPQRS